MIETRQQSQQPEGKISVGDAAPDFALCDQYGTLRRLSDFAGLSNVVLFFYPKANSSGCTTEACGFRDEYDRFRDAGAAVLGISSDDVAEQRRFAERNNLPFLLLSDEGGAVRKQYGVPRTLGIIAGRTTYVIDRAGVVQQVFNSQANVLGHVSAALKTLATLNAPPQKDR